jgi:hypothetical protein
MAETGRFLAVPAADLKWEALVPGFARSDIGLVGRLQ